MKNKFVVAGIEGIVTELKLIGDSFVDFFLFPKSFFNNLFNIINGIFMLALVTVYLFCVLVISVVLLLFKGGAFLIKNCKSIIREAPLLPMKARVFKSAIKESKNIKKTFSKCKLYLNGKITAAELSLYIKDFKFVLPKDQERLDKFARLMVGGGRLPLYTAGLDYLNYDLDMNPLYDENGNLISKEKYDEMVAYMDKKHKFKNISVMFGTDPEYAQIEFCWAPKNTMRGDAFNMRWSLCAGANTFNNFIEEDIMEEMHQRYNEGSLFAKVMKSGYDREKFERFSEEEKRYYRMFCSSTSMPEFSGSILDRYDGLCYDCLCPSLFAAREDTFSGGYKLDNPYSMNMGTIRNVLKCSEVTDKNWVDILLLASSELLREQIYRNTIFYLVLERKSDYEEKCAALNREMAGYNSQTFKELCGWIERLAFDNEFRKDMLNIREKYSLTSLEKEEVMLEISNVFIKYGFGDLYICHKFGGFMSEKKKELRAICEKYAPDDFLDMWSSGLNYMYSSNEIEILKKDTRYSEAVRDREIERYSEYAFTHTPSEVSAMAEIYRNNWKKQNAPQFAK